MTTRIVLVGASPLLAGGLHAALGAHGEWEVAAVGADPVEGDAAVGHARDAAEALALYTALPPDLPTVLLGDDLREVARRSAGDPRALGLLAVDATPARLRAALAAVLQGLSVREPGLVADAGEVARSAASAGLAPTAALAADHEPLTPREIEVFELLGKGLSNRDIGGMLGISAHTAKYHVAQILAKVGAATRAEAVAVGLRLGLIGL